MERSSTNKSCRQKLGIWDSLSGCSVQIPVLGTLVGICDSILIEYLVQAPRLHASHVNHNGLDLLKPYCSLSLAPSRDSIAGHSVSSGRIGYHAPNAFCIGLMCGLMHEWFRMCEGMCGLWRTGSLSARLITRQE